MKTKMSISTLKIGLLILLISQMHIGYHRISDRERLFTRFVVAIQKSASENPLYQHLFHGNLQNKFLIVFHLFDTFIEVIIPILLLLTGWRVLLILSLLHFLVLGSWVYNLFGETKTQFQEIMSMMTIMQILGVLLYIFSVRKPTKIPAKIGN